MDEMTGGWENRLEASELSNLLGIGNWISP